MKILYKGADCELNEIQSKCFTRLLPEEAELVKSSKSVVLYEKGETIMKQKAFSSQVAFVLSGLAKETIESSTGKKLNIRLLASGDFAGLSSVFSGEPYACSVTALTDSMCCIIENQAFVNLMLRNNAFALLVMKKHCSSEDHAATKLVDVIYKQMHGKLAGTLGYLSQFSFEGQSVFPHLSRKDLAEFSGLSLESTVKILKAMESDGLIRLDARDIHILNVAQLNEISEKG
jgi:CRP-like cAMP-binding protein